MSRKKGLTATLATVFASLLWLYWPVVSGQVEFFERDIILYWRPHVEWAVRTLSQGHLPTWVPGSAFGMPFAADPSFQVFYPVTWLNVLFTPSIFYPIYVFGHALVGAAGIYRLLSVATRKVQPSLLAALAFALSGPWVSGANLWHHYAGVAFIPWVVLGVERVRLRVPRAWIPLSAAAGLQALAGSADLCLMSGVLGAFRLLTAPRRRFKKVVPDLLRAIALAGALASIQWIPTAAILGESERARHDLGTILYWSVPPPSLPDMFVPGLMSEQVLADEWRAKYMNNRSPFLASLYLGATLLPLALRGMRVFPAGAFAFFSLVTASLGRHVFLVSQMALVPPFAWFRYPQKIFWPVAFVFAVLVGVGFDSVRRKARFAWPVWVPAALLLATAFVVRRPDGVDMTPSFMLARVTILVAVCFVLSGDRGRFATCGLIAAVMADLTFSGRWGNNLASGVVGKYRPPHVDTIKAIVGGSRIHVGLSSRPIDEMPDEPKFQQPVAEALLVLDRLLPPQLLRWGLLGSIDPDFTGLVTSEYSRVLGQIEEAPLRTPLLLWTSGVKYGLRFGAFEPTPQSRTLQSFDTIARGKVRLVEMPWPEGRVRRVSTIVHAPRDEDALPMILGRGFNPETMAVSHDVPSASFPAGGTVSIASEKPNEVVVTTDGSDPGWVILNDELRRGWSVTVDGEEEKLLRMNSLFRGVAVKPGAHTIVFHYSIPGFRVGALAACVALLFFAKEWLQKRNART